MRFKISVVILFSLFLNINSYAQLTGTSGGDAQELAELLVGGGISVLGASVSCPGDGYGQAEGSGSNLGFANAITLTTGSMADIGGPNTSGSTSVETGNGGDGDLGALGVGTLFDCCSFELDFQPEGDEISFNYVFASEEYPEWVGSQFNDAFALFISGPDIPQTNIAIIPGTTTPVAINNVNDGSFSGYYVDNTGGGSVEYDGFTTPMVATASVTPCNVYHLKFVVCDVGDGSWDSAVFVEEGSLSSNGVDILPPVSSVGGDIDYAIENCADGIIAFVLENPFPDEHTVFFTLGGTATYGVDYAPINNFITFGAGETTAEILIEPIVDGEFEFDETVVVTLFGVCGEPIAEQILTIQDEVTAFSDAGEVLCEPNTPVQLFATGGDSYYWTPEDLVTDFQSASPVAFVDTTTTFTVSIFNGPCVNTVDVVITLLESENPPYAGEDQVTCPGVPIQLEAINGITYDWLPAEGLSCYDCPDPVFEYDQEVTYTVIMIDEFFCEREDEVTISISDIEVEAQASPIQICPGEDVVLSAVGDSAQYSWLISPSMELLNEDTLNLTVNPTETTTYMLVGNLDGCTDTSTVLITVDESIDIAVDPPEPVLCIGESVTLNMSGASDYLWTLEDGSDIDIDNPTNYATAPSETTTLTIVGFNSTGNCTDTTMVTIVVNPLPILSLDQSAPILCEGEELIINVENPESETTYTWTSDDPSLSLDAPDDGSSLAITPTSPVNLSVEAENEFGCIENTSLFVEVYPVPNPMVEGAAICEGGSVTLTATGADAYLWEGSDGSSETGSSLSLSPTESISYTITGTNDGTCSETTTAEVQVFPSLTLNVSASATVICEGESVNIDVSGAVNYNWTDNTGGPGQTGATITVSPSSTTIYSVLGDDGNGCEANDQIEIVVNPIPVVSALASPSALCDGESTTLSASGADSYSWLDDSGIELGTDETLSITPTETTTYTLAGMSSACPDTTTVTVTVNELPDISISNPIVTLCANAAAQVSASGAGVGGSYSWEPQTGITISPDGTVIDLSPLSDIVYTVTGTTADGCVGTATVQVFINDNLTLGIDPPEPFVCSNGDPVSITVFGGEFYDWFPGTGLSATSGNTVEAFPATTTTYTIQGSDANGCTGDITFDVIVHDPPVLSISPEETICIGESAVIALSLDDPTSQIISWDPSDSLDDATSDNPIATPVANTIYTATVIDAFGCTSSISTTINVTQLDDLLLVADAESICVGSTATLTATSSGISYDWTPTTDLTVLSDGVVEVSPSVATTYTVLASDEFGCTTQTSIDIDVVTPALNLAASTSLICIGETVSLEAADAGSYVWSTDNEYLSTSGNLAEVAPLVTTTYTVTGQTFTANGQACELTAEVTVEVTDISLSGPSQAAICPGDNVDLTFTGGLDYAWSPADGLSSTSGETVTASPASSTTYTVVATDINGCTDSAEVEVLVSSELIISTPEPVYGFCEGSGGVDLIASGAESYTWTPSEGLSTTSGANVTANPTTTTTYTIDGTNASGCFGTTTVIVEVYPNPIAFAGDDVAICLGDSTQLLPSGGTSYAWNDPAGFLENTVDNPWAMPTETTTYSVLVTDDNGCEDTDELTVIVNPLPTIDAGDDGEICSSSIFSITSATATNFDSSEWTGGTGTFEDPTALNTSYDPGDGEIGTVNLTLTVTGECGTISDEIELIVNQSDLVLDAGQDITVCEGDPILLSGSASNYNSLAWTGGAGQFVAVSEAQTEYLPANNETGTFDLSLSGSDDCGEAFDFATITIQPLVNPDAGPGGQINIGETISLSASGAETYNWTPSATLSCSDCPDPIATPTETTTYFLSSNDPCSFEDDVTIVVLSDPVILIPNAFSPNGDNLNEVFRHTGFGYQLKGFRIFNRWGQMVFDTENIEDAWDGNFNGSPQEVGVYVFVVQYTVDPEGKDIEVLKGNVSLIR